MNLYKWNGNINSSKRESTECYKCIIFLFNKSIFVFKTFSSIEFPNYSKKPSMHGSDNSSTVDRNAC